MPRPIQGIERTWTPGERELFLWCRAAGMKTRHVSQVFGISYDMVYNVTKRLNDQGRVYKRKPRTVVYAPVSRTVPRNCMTCGEEFQSEGSHHRLCVTHRRDSQSMDIEMAQQAVK